MKEESEGDAEGRKGGRGRKRGEGRNRRKEGTGGKGKGGKGKGEKGKQGKEGRRNYHHAAGRCPPEPLFCCQVRNEYRKRVERKEGTGRKTKEWNRRTGTEWKDERKRI